LLMCAGAAKAAVVITGAAGGKLKRLDALT
jgi:hypothetical protein